MLNKSTKNGFYRIINQRTGKIKLLKNYKNGKLHGKIIYYWDNGRIRLSGQYNKMSRIGIWRNYNPQGELILEENYDNLIKLNESKQTRLSI